MFWTHLQLHFCFLRRMFAEKGHLCDHTCALGRDKTKVAKNFPRALPSSPGGFTQKFTPISSAPAVGGQLVIAPTNITASPAFQPHSAFPAHIVCPPSEGLDPSCSALALLCAGS